MDVDSLKSMASIEVVGTNGTAVDGVWAVATSGEKIGLIAVIVDTCPITKKEVGVYNYHIEHIATKISKKICPNEVIEDLSFITKKKYDNKFEI